MERPGVVVAPVETRRGAASEAEALRRVDVPVSGQGVEVAEDVVLDEEVAGAHVEGVAALEAALALVGVGGGVRGGRGRGVWLEVRVEFENLVVDVLG